MVDLPVPDKLSIATYLISYYNYFKEMQPQKRIKMANINEETPRSVPTKLASSNQEPLRREQNILHETQPAAPAGPKNFIKSTSSPVIQTKATKPLPVPSPPPSVINKRYSAVPSPSAGDDGMAEKKPSPKVPLRPASTVFIQTKPILPPVPSASPKLPPSTAKSVPQLPTPPPPASGGGLGVVGRRSKFAAPKPQPVGEKPVAMETEEPSKVAATTTQALQPPPKVEGKYFILLLCFLLIFVVANVAYHYYL